MKKKRIMLIVGICGLCLSGCGKDSLSANQIEYQKKLLEYNTDEVDDIFFDNGIDLDINDSNIVRAITITNKDVNTFRDISVGDKNTKVQAKYNNEISMGETIFVVISNNSELDPMSEDKPDDAIYINYHCSGDIIEKIQIYDSLYAEKMK